VPGATIVSNLSNAGYNPGPNAHVYGLACNICTDPATGGPSVAQQVANGFGVPTEGLQQVPGKLTYNPGENAAGPVSYENPPPVPHVPVALQNGGTAYLVQQVADDNGQYAVCTPN
jgi:hypothetical protein